MSGATHSFAAVIQALKSAAPVLTEWALSSPYCNLHRMDGDLDFKEITIAGTGAEVITSLFSYTAPFELVDLYGLLTDVTNIVTLSGCYFDLWDGANSIPITADGLDLSAAGLDAIFFKDRVVANPLRLLNSATAGYQEPAANPRIFQGGLCQAKTGVTNYVRFRCDTDANTDVTMMIGMAWVCRAYDDPGVVVVP